MSIAVKAEIARRRGVVTFYTKPNCPLCDKALEQIELARARTNFELREINILSDPAVYEQYKHVIPVVCIDGVEVFRYRVDSDALVKALE
jgi:glutaredoxin